MANLRRYCRYSLVPLVLLTLMPGCGSTPVATDSKAQSTVNPLIRGSAKYTTDSWSISKLYEKDKPVQLVRIHENPSAKQSDFPLLFEVHGKTIKEFPNKHELDQFALGETAVEELEKANKCVLMVCATGRGERTWFYYGKTLENAKEIAIAMQSFKPKIDASPDPDWNCYRGFVELKQSAGR